MNNLTQKAFEIMDEAEALFLSGESAKGLNKLGDGLQKIRQDFIVEEWESFADSSFIKHPVVKIVHQDPFTHHAFIKPRNYAGDAELVDYMYGCRKLSANTTELGKEIYQAGLDCPAPQSVRARREIISSLIDNLAKNSKDLRILSIACGHLREASISQAVLDGKVSEYFALDQDALSLEVVKNELTKYNVKPIHASIKSLFTNGHEFQKLDFVYAAGLYDYLSQNAANKLTSKMFQMLQSGGRLLVANFAPCLRDIGYMETFMQWKLIYREEAEVAEFASLIPINEIAEQRLFWDEPHNVIYLEIVKK